MQWISEAFITYISRFTNLRLILTNYIDLLSSVIYLQITKVKWSVYS
jgi:hypothetical protein